MCVSKVFREDATLLSLGIVYALCEYFVNCSPPQHKISWVDLRRDLLLRFGITYCTYFGSALYFPNGFSHTWGRRKPYFSGIEHGLIT